MGLKNLNQIYVCIMSRSHMNKGKKIKVRGKTCEITHLVEVLYHLRLHDVRSYQGQLQIDLSNYYVKVSGSQSIEFEQNLPNLATYLGQTVSQISPFFRSSENECNETNS